MYTVYLINLYALIDAMGYEVDLCYAFIIPERMQKQGIQLIEVRTKRHTFLAIAPPGYLYQNWDVLEFIPITSMLQMKLEYQINNFIKIGDEDCVPDPLFNRDDCVLEQLIQVSIFIYINWIFLSKLKVYRIQKNCLDVYHPHQGTMAFRFVQIPV